MIHLWAHGGSRAPILQEYMQGFSFVQYVLFLRQVFSKIMVFPIDNHGVFVV